ncbi:hypothetical protein [Sphingosinicella soli]|uniref:Uncharacterized protein n=1 Tax=Sphingosinicella soli TaxID=333708 RepID=A0A7W7B2C4_9SPHN|nr:hypothetical protein [Sphingosinicella soli]MBB4632709.1 hypothetical protein [Sphingosinicella soli]
MAAAVALAGCSVQYPFDGARFCFASMDEADKLKSVLNSVSKTHELSFVDDSIGVRKDLVMLESPLADQPIIYLLIDDDAWFPASGPIMISNLGASSPRDVRVSFFQMTSWFGSNAKTDEIASDVKTALSKNWTLAGYTGSKPEDEAPRC